MNISAARYRGLGGVAETIGGVADHVHLLISFKPTHTICDFVRELKKATTTWARMTVQADFEWQDGYSIFSVSASAADEVRCYIDHQEEHHQSRDYRAELELLLQRHGIDFKPEYLE